MDLGFLDTLYSKFPSVGFGYGIHFLKITGHDKG
jgi:hypothetical protein